MTLKGGNNNTRLGLLIHFNIITVVLFYDTAWKWIWVRGCSFFFNFESRPATFLGDILRPLFLHSTKSEKGRRKLWWNIQKKLPKTKKKLDQITASGWQCRQNAPDFRRPSCKKERKERLIDRLVPFNWNRAKTVSRYGKDDFVAIFFIILFCSTPLMSHGRSRCPFLPSFTEFYRVFFCSFSSILF